MVKNVETIYLKILNVSTVFNLEHIFGISLKMTALNLFAGLPSLISKHYSD